MSDESGGTEPGLRDDEVLASEEEELEQVDELAFGKLITSALELCARFDPKFHCGLNFIERCCQANGVQEKLWM